MSTVSYHIKQKKKIIDLNTGAFTNKIKLLH